MGQNAPAEGEEAMARPHVLQMRPMMPHVEAALAEAYEVARLWEAADRDALLAEVGPRVRAVATDGHHGCPPAVFDRLPALEIVASYGVGYDAIDIPACKARFSNSRTSLTTF